MLMLMELRSADILRAKLTEPGCRIWCRMDFLHWAPFRLFREDCAACCTCVWDGHDIRPAQASLLQ